MKGTKLMDIIGDLFIDLPGCLKAETLATLYFVMTDAQKDDFLKRTDNA